MRCKKTEPTTSEKVKGAAATVATIAAAKAGEAKVKTSDDILPALAERVDAVREAAAPHLETAAEKAADLRDAAADKTADLRDAAAEKTADQRDAAADKLGTAKAVAAAKLADVAQSAADARDEAAKAASDKADDLNKKAKKLDKKADKASDKFEKKAKKSGKKAEKKATKKFGPSTTQKAAFGLAALRGKAKADDKLNADSVRDYYNDELLPHLKEILAAAAASGTAASADLVNRLPEDAQKQVVRYAPSLAPAKKKGGALIVLGSAALAGAGYLFYADRSKNATSSVRVSQTSAPQTSVATSPTPAVSTTHGDSLEGGNSMAEIFTHETVAEPANGVGTAATWTDAEKTGHMSNADLEGNDVVVEEKRQGRHAARDDS